MFFKKKEHPTQIEKFNRLTIQLSYGREIFENYKENEKMYFPWKAFLKWYYCRPQSTNYIFRHQDGMINIKRDSVIGFRIDLIRN